MNGSSQPGNWVKIFSERAYLAMTPSRMDEWISANKFLFDTMRSLYVAGTSVLDIGSGPGRHACGMASLGFRVVGIDRDAKLVRQATENARTVVPDADIRFYCADLAEVDRLFPGERFLAVTHGGLLEHLSSPEEIREEAARELKLAPNVVFDVPIDSAKNRDMFAGDGVFRQVWAAQYWLETVLAGFNVAAAAEEPHAVPGMTDDLAIWLRR